MAKEIKKNVVQFYQNDGPDMGLAFLGEEPTISGYPFKPVLIYTKGFESKGNSMVFPVMTVTAIPFYNQLMKISFPLGVQFDFVNSRNPIELDALVIEAIIPKSFPQSSARNDIAQWQKNVGQITIENFDVTSGVIQAKGQGVIGLDDNLQLTTNLITRTSEHDEIIAFYIENGQLKPFAGALALAALRTFEKFDDVTNENFVEVPLKISERQVYLGPARLLSLPPISWN